MSITCPDLYRFMDVILELTKRGITFKADATNFSIKLTGGF